MSRFYHEQKSTASRRLLLSAAVFVVVLFLFVGGVSSVSDSTDRRARETLQNAITRDITWCYATEGTYPENLQYIKDHYGLTYDEERFFVDYHVLGANILPNVTIIDLKTGEMLSGKGAK